MERVDNIGGTCLFWWITAIMCLFCFLVCLIPGDSGIFNEDVLLIYTICSAVLLFYFGFKVYKNWMNNVKYGIILFLAYLIGSIILHIDHPLDFLEWGYLIFWILSTIAWIYNVLQYFGIVKREAYVVDDKTESSIPIEPYKTSEKSEPEVEMWVRK